MNEKISVVVPVYKTEKYLYDSVQSLLAQTYQNLDIILVDDGSPDRCGEICDRLATQDARIRVLHKSNGGVSRARFDGIYQASGEYVAFIDSDDTVDPEYIETLYHAMHEFSADVATCGHRVKNADGSIVERFCFSTGNICLSNKEALRRMLYDDCCSLSLCCKLYRTAWLRDIPPSDLILGEDSYVCLRYFLKCRRTAHTGACCYTYYQREDSAVHANAGVKFYDYVHLYDLLLDEFQREAPECMRAYENRLVENNFTAFLKLCSDPAATPEMIGHIAENIKKYKDYIIKYKPSHIRTKAACIISSFGIKTVYGVYSLLSHLK